MSFQAKEPIPSACHSNTITNIAKFIGLKKNNRQTEYESHLSNCLISDCKSMFYNNMKNFAKKIVLCNFASGTNVPR